MKTILSLFFFAVMSLSLVQGQIRIGGSDLMDPHVRGALEEHLGYEEIEAEFELTGSYGAAERLLAGEIDLGFLAVPDGREPGVEDLRVIPFAYQVVVPVVSPENPLSSATLSELAAAFGADEAATINRWGQLGLTGEWSARRVSLMAVTPIEYSLPLDLFRHTVLTTPELRRGIDYRESFDDLLDRVDREAGALALLPYLPPEGNFSGKLLAIAEDGDDRPVTPGIDSIHSGDYPLRLPIYLAFPPDQASDLRETLRFLVSQEAAEALIEAGLIPLPEIERQRLSLEFERL